ARGRPPGSSAPSPPATPSAAAAGGRGRCAPRSAPGSASARTGDAPASGHRHPPRSRCSSPASNSLRILPAKRPFFVLYQGLLISVFIEFRCDKTSQDKLSQVAGTHEQPARGAQRRGTRPVGIDHTCLREQETMNDAKM